MHFCMFTITGCKHQQLLNLNLNKCEGGKSGAFNVRNGAGEDGEAASANPHLNVLETKQ